MTISTATLLWIAVVLLAAVVIYLVWQRLRPQQTPVSAPEPTWTPPGQDGNSPPVAENVRRAPPRSGVAPPPAMAGERPLDPGTGSDSGSGSGGTMAPSGSSRRPSAPPPPAAAGPGVPRAPASPQVSQAPQTTTDRTPMPPKRTSAPPPASAGGAAAGAATAANQPKPPPSSAPVQPANYNPKQAPKADMPRGHNPLLAAKSWGYQLQKLNLKRAAAAPFDVLVIDYARDGSDETALSPSDIDRMRQKPGGGTRQILAYLSIGEAESYRSYWDDRWAQSKPQWLLSENPEWKENFAVCFWDPGWQRLICGAPSAYLDKIIAAGFDGVYLDKCDVFEDLERRERKAAKTRPDIEGDMVAFISHLSRYAKSKSPGFLVVMQNTENLLEHDAVIAAIDGMAKEELLFGLPGPERKNAKADVQDARRALDLAKAAGKPVFVVEYLDNPTKIAEAAAYMEGAGYVLYVAPKDRELDRLNYDVFEA